QGPQRQSLKIFHRQIHPALTRRLEDFDDMRMVQALADLLLTAEALVEHDVALELQIGDLERDRGAADSVGSLEDRRHAAARDQLGHLILVEALADANFAHDLSAYTAREPGAEFGGREIKWSIATPQELAQTGAPAARNRR